MNFDYLKHNGAGFDMHLWLYLEKHKLVLYTVESFFLYKEIFMHN